MYNHNITIQETADYIADMAELNATSYQPTETEMEEMHADHMSHEHNGYWWQDGDRWEWRDNETDQLRAYIEWDEESQSYAWTNADCDHGECQYDADEIALAKVKAMEDWVHYNALNEERW